MALHPKPAPLRQSVPSSDHGCVARSPAPTQLLRRNHRSVPCALGNTPEHTEHFDDYVEAVEWAQDYAQRNRDLMMEQIVGAVRASGEVPPFSAELKAINCHHNYVAREKHFGENVLITR